MPNGPYGEHLGEHVHQATGMVSVQAGCDMPAALAMLIIRSAELDQTVELTALDVLDRVFRFDAH